MRRAIVAVIAILSIAAVLSGCGGEKVPGVPDTVAKVNGKPIEASTYLDQVSRRSGQDVLRSLIEQQIILQWAKDEDVSPTEEQIKMQTDLFKDQGIYDDQVKNMGDENVKSEIAAMQARANLAKKFSKISPEQLKETYEQTKSMWVHGKRKQIAVIVNPDSTKLEEAAKKARDGEDFDKVAAQYGTGMRQAFKLMVDESSPQGLPPGIMKAVKDTKVGEVSKPVSFGQPGGPSQFALVKVLKEQPASNKKYDQVKAEIQNLAAMQASQSDPDFISKLNDKMKEAKVEVEIEQFEDLVDQFKNPPESPMMGAPRRVRPTAPPPAGP